MNTIIIGLICFMAGLVIGRYIEQIIPVLIKMQNDLQKMKGGNKN